MPLCVSPHQGGAQAEGLQHALLGWVLVAKAQRDPASILPAPVQDAFRSQNCPPAQAGSLQISRALQKSPAMPSPSSAEHPGPSLLSQRRAWGCSGGRVQCGEASGCE